MRTNDRRLIEDYLPIEAISKEAAREKSVRKGHISTLHLWWARRPLVACRAAVYGALVPASRFAPENGPENKRQSLGRANAARFVTDLCKYPGNPSTIRKAQEHILQAHAERLTAELAEAKKTGQWPGWVDEFKWPKDTAQVSPEDIEGGRAPRPRVLDMFAGGGAIPLEALRLGCEAYALDLNPVAYIIELCTLVYPQKYGRPDPSARGMTGPKNEKGETTWGGLADEVRYWGNWVLEQVRREIGDLYPIIPDPEYKGKRSEIEFDRKTGRWVATHNGASAKNNLLGEDDKKRAVPPGYLTPVAYLWTRTVKCKNPACGATVPLVKQTWLCKKKNRYAALRMVASKGARQVRFEVVEATTEKGLGFDPAAFSKGGNATCPFCGTVADSDYVKAEGCAKRMGQQMMAIVCSRPGRNGKLYLSADELPVAPSLPEEDIEQRIAALCARTGLTVPDEPIEARMTGGICLPYGLTTFGDLFTPRQMLCLLSFVEAVRQAQLDVLRTACAPSAVQAAATAFALMVDRIADRSSSLVRWDATKETLGSTFARQALPMVWDYCETVPLVDASGGADNAIEWIERFFDACKSIDAPGTVSRGTATALPWLDGRMDAVITDPPYYDNVDYAKLSDFFYVWLKRTVGHLYPEHFATSGTPKKQEAVADPVRYGRSRGMARRGYEQMMAESFCEAHRVLKPGGEMVVVYAHKTSLGWATLVDALRQARFTVTEAWPLDTEMRSRLVAMETAALASSIFLVARKRPAYTDRGFSAEEKECLKAFCKLCSEVTECRFWRTIPQMDHTIHASVKPDGTWEVEHPHYDNDDFRSFLAYLRKLLAQKEPSHFFRVLSILGRHADPGEQAVFKQIRKVLQAEGKSFGGIKLQIGTADAEEVFSPEKVADVLFNADVFHSAPDLQEPLEKLKQYEDIVRVAFLRYATIIVNQASQLAGVIEFWGYTKDRPDIGSYETEVRPELESIVRERVTTLWDMGISGANLVIASVGAGLRAFTRFGRVEYANGEEVPAEKFLAEVEMVVLESILARLSKEVGGNGGRYGLAGIDPATRFYVLWRYTYRSAELGAGEAIVFANGTHVELDGPGSLTYGTHALVEKKKGTYRLRDFRERGDDEKLGLPSGEQPAPLIDALHRTLWLMENHPRELTQFLRDSGVNREQMRLVAQALAGPALKGGELGAVSTGNELAALATLTANWRSVVEDAARDQWDEGLGKGKTP
jgi:putative DNA methylase